MSTFSLRLEKLSKHVDELRKTSSPYRSKFNATATATANGPLKMTKVSDAEEESEKELSTPKRDKGKNSSRSASCVAPASTLSVKRAVGEKGKLVRRMLAKAGNGVSSTDSEESHEIISSGEKSDSVGVTDSDTDAGGEEDEDPELSACSTSKREKRNVENKDELKHRPSKKHKQEDAKASENTVYSEPMVNLPKELVSKRPWLGQGIFRVEVIGDPCRVTRGQQVTCFNL